MFASECGPLEGASRESKRDDIIFDGGVADVESLTRASYSERDARRARM